MTYTAPHPAKDRPIGSLFLLLLLVYLFRLLSPVFPTVTFSFIFSKLYASYLYLIPYLFPLVLQLVLQLVWLIVKAVSYFSFSFFFFLLYEVSLDNQQLSWMQQLIVFSLHHLWSPLPISSLQIQVFPKSIYWKYCCITIYALNEGTETV